MHYNICLITLQLNPKNELHELRKAIAFTKSEAANAGRIYTYKGITEPSFTASHSVTNCGEIWSAHEAIFNGAKFDELSFQSVYASNGSSLDMCVAITLLLNILDSRWKSNG